MSVHGPSFEKLEQMSATTGVIEVDGPVPVTSGCGWMPSRAELDFYSQYSWCLNATPTMTEVLEHLSEELGKVGRLQDGWQVREVITNIFLLSCAVTDTIDDYLAGTIYDFSKIEKRLSWARPAVRIAETALAAKNRLRGFLLSSLSRWRHEWAMAITEFLFHSMVGGRPDHTTVLRQCKSLTSLLHHPSFPKRLYNCRPRVPAFFRSRDFAPADCLELGRKVIDGCSTNQPILVVGIRTAGSFLAPLLCAYLRKMHRRADWVAIRPKKGLASSERAVLANAGQKKARVLIVDESIHSGQTLAVAVDLLRHMGFSDEDIVVLNPAEPAFPDWRNSKAVKYFSKIDVLTLEPSERYKQQLLDSGAADVWIREYFAASGYRAARLVDDPVADGLNSSWAKTPERVDVRLKRLYAVLSTNNNGESEVRYVLAKSVGWGWLGYHAFVTGLRLSKFVPPIIGLRDGILFTEWLTEKPSVVAETHDRKRLIECIACYVAERARNLTLNNYRASDLASEGRHKGFEILANLLSKAYPLRSLSSLKRAWVRQELAEQDSSTPVLTDSKMSPDEWIWTGPRPVKTDFEHHGQGKNELGAADPAYDLADAIFHFRLTNNEATQLVRSYIRASGDAGVKKRLFFNKLLAGIWAQNLAELGLQGPRSVQRRQEFNEQYIRANDFLVAQTTWECSRSCRRPQAVVWRAPLVVTDVDGVLDRMVFGFPSTTASGVSAILLLHSHGFAIAINTARTLEEVRQYCRAYGFAGGVAEFGGAIWDAVQGQEHVLVSSESQHEMEQARHAFRRIPGTFQNDNYRYSLKVYTYQGARTVPLAPLVAQDVLAELGLNRLQIHHTGIDTIITAKETDKGTGLLALADITGVPTASMLTIGDSAPDLDMFRFAGRSFAPANVSCRGEAKSLGCRIVDRAYQPGLLQIARMIVHPDGNTCGRCQVADRAFRTNKTLFASLLTTADQRPFASILNNAFSISPLSLFRK